jgi:hypothetical protein
MHFVPLKVLEHVYAKPTISTPTVTGPVKLLKENGPRNHGFALYEPSSAHTMRLRIPFTQEHHGETGILSTALIPILCIL